MLLRPLLRPVLREPFRSPLTRRGGWKPEFLFAGGTRKGIYRNADDITTVYQDTGGLTPVTATGQAVQYIKDKSGNGLHGVVVGATWEVDGNGKHYLNFSGAGAGITPTSVSGWTADMVSVSAIRQSAASFVLNTPATSGTKFFGVSTSGDATLTYNEAGTPDTCVDGVVISPNTRGALFTATGTTQNRLEGNYPLDLSAWTNYLFGKYGALIYGGRFYGDIVLDAPTASELNKIQTFLAGQGTISVPATYPLNRGFVLGDSTVAAWLAQNTVISYVTTSRTVADLSAPGEVINQQLARWQAAAGRSSAKWAVIQIGLNDLDPTEASSVAIARYQALVTSVRNLSAAATKIVVSQMTPCRQRLIDIYGATDGPVAYQKWLDMNAAIAGSGPTPITSVDGRVTSHVAALGDGSDNLAAAYEIAGTVDHIHENNAGRQIVAAAWTTALNLLGVL